MQKSNASSEEDPYQVRKLELSDKEKGFIQLLQQLTRCDSVSDEEFQKRFQELTLYGDDHIICVIEDLSGKIVATGSVFIEKKFIRNCGKVGHIEDVVVDSSARGMQLGKKIIGFLKDHARSMGCYKVILDCSVDNKAFYEKCGFKQKEIQMLNQLLEENDKGAFMAAFTIPSLVRVVEGEAMGLIFAMSWTMEMGFEKVEFELDSK